MKAAAKGASGQSRQGHGKGRAVDNHDPDGDFMVAELYLALRKPLEDYLRHLVNEHDAQDIVHDVFLNLCRSRPTWITSQEARRFLFVAVRSRARNHSRKLARCDSWDPVVLDSVELSRGSDGETSFDELQTWIVSMLEPDLGRVIRRRLEGLGLRQIAEMEGLSLASIKRRLLKARRILRILSKKNEPFSQSQLKYK